MAPAEPTTEPESMVGVEVVYTVTVPRYPGDTDDDVLDRGCKAHGNLVADARIIDERPPE